MPRRPRGARKRRGRRNRSRRWMRKPGWRFWGRTRTSRLQGHWLASSPVKRERAAGAGPSRLIEVWPARFPRLQRAIDEITLRVVPIGAHPFAAITELRGSSRAISGRSGFAEARISPRQRGVEQCYYDCPHPEVSAAMRFCLT
jgi:hypothetical protein